MGCQRCFCSVCPLSSSACLGHVDVKYAGFLEKGGIFASSATSGRPRRESVHCLSLVLRCCWQKNQKRSFEVISELYLKHRLLCQRKQRKCTVLMEEGSGCVCSFFPILEGSSLRAGIILLLSCTMNYMYGVCCFRT